MLLCLCARVLVCPCACAPVCLLTLARTTPSSYLRRDTASLPQPAGAAPYGGWCSGGNGGCVWVGHYLSALAFAAASEGDDALAQKGAYIVRVLAEVQAAIAKHDPSTAGWVGSGPWEDNLFNANKSHASSAGFYSSHKILAGLIDQFREVKESRWC